MKKILNALFSFLGVRFRFYNDKPLKDKPFTISYALTVCTEATELTHLLLFLKPYLREHDEVIVQADLSIVTKEVKQVVNTYKDMITVYSEFPLNSNFGAFKNRLNSLCHGEYIFQLDADEMPEKGLMDSLHTIISNNPKVELFKLPRYNILTDLVSHERQEEIDWPDYQGRVFKNVPDRILWHRPVHERIFGHCSYVYLPKKKDLALVHSKTRQQHLIRLAQYFAIKNQGNIDLW